MTVNSKTKKFGLSQKEINDICSVFRRYNDLDKVILYGSRAIGNYQPNSDIDFVLQGSELTLKTLMQIEQELDDLLLPYKIDLAIFHMIENQDLLEHIERAGKLFYSRSEKVHLL